MSYETVKFSLVFGCRSIEFRSINIKEYRRKELFKSDRVCKAHPGYTASFVKRLEMVFISKKPLNIIALGVSCPEKSGSDPADTMRYVIENIKKDPDIISLLATNSHAIVYIPDYGKTPCFIRDEEFIKDLTPSGAVAAIEHYLGLGKDSMPVYSTLPEPGEPQYRWFGPDWDAPEVVYLPQSQKGSSAA